MPAWNVTDKINKSHQFYKELSYGLPIAVLVFGMIMTIICFISVHLLVYKWKKNPFNVLIIEVLNKVWVKLTLEIGDQFEVKKYGADLVRAILPVLYEVKHNQEEGSDVSLVQECIDEIKIAENFFNEIAQSAEKLKWNVEVDIKIALTKLHEVFNHIHIEDNSSDVLNPNNDITEYNEKVKKGITEAKIDFGKGEE